MKFRWKYSLIIYVKFRFLRAYLMREKESFSILWWVRESLVEYRLVALNKISRVCLSVCWRKLRRTVRFAFWHQLAKLNKMAPKGATMAQEEETTELVNVSVGNFGNTFEIVEGDVVWMFGVAAGCFFWKCPSYGRFRFAPGRVGKCVAHAMRLWDKACFIVHRHQFNAWDDRVDEKFVPLAIRCGCEAMLSLLVTHTL